MCKNTTDLGEIRNQTSVAAPCGSLSNTWLPEYIKDLCPPQVGRLPGGVWNDEEVMRKAEINRKRGQGDTNQENQGRWSGDGIASSMVSGLWTHVSAIYHQPGRRPIADGARGSKGVRKHRDRRLFSLRVPELTDFRSRVVPGKWTARTQT